MPIRRLLLLFTYITFAWSLRADTTRPSTLPAVEDHSPRATALQMNVAMRAFDEQAMFDLQHTVTPDQARYARAGAQADAYVARLLAAAEEKFGKAAVAKVQEAIGDISDDDIRAAEEVRDNDNTARLVGRKEKFEFRYIRQNGSWKIDVPASLTRPEIPILYFIDSTYRRGNWAKVAAQDVAAGKYKTLEELLSEIGRRFPQDSTEADAPTTQPRP